MEHIYISTDNSEATKILGLENYKSKSGIRTDDFKEIIISKNGFSLSIIDVSIKHGQKTQEDEKLGFNPMSIISGEINEDVKSCLIKKLVKQGLWVAISNNGEAKHFLPTKYDGYQGGGFIPND